ncbi:sulfatase-like hydrolase/transferase [uncultured Lacinutrix sp.]|uniref:sulfatase-like hydrolase/transferase n=1 Tax=uncultured Lacinutrix sp. TaxID=574032 RepID=UPI0026278113|nr:sulfatase-like hydrolase/transferase [uncultured Lacinutrix sp.]
MSFPLLLFFTLGYFLVSETDSFYRELGAIFCITVICISFILLVKSYKLKSILLVFFQWLLALFIAFKLFFYYTFDTKPTASSIFVIFETNATESSEFFKSYFNFSFIVILMLCFSICIYLIIKSLLKEKAFNFLDFSITNRAFQISLIGLILVSGYMLRRSFSEQSIVLKLSESIKDYNIAKDYYKEHLAQSINNDIKITSQTKEEQIGIVIIGEATSRWHMGLYNYNRKTNPLLSKMKEELYVFNDVIAPDVMTILSLEKALTLSNNKNPKAENNFSVVQLANAANYDTYWISNQQPVGFTESTPTIIATAAKQQQFLATDNYFSTIYDESLIPEIEKVITSKGKRKLVFVHLIGTHRTYKKRYPESYNYFKGVNERTKFKTDKSKRLVNEYDNAIRYNDYVISEIINLVKKQHKNSFVVYFSDHGDEVYDTIDFVGHHRHKGSKPMFDIPFIAWFSDKYKLKNSRIDTLTNYSNRKYNAEDFIYSFSDIINVDFIGNDKSRSLFNINFKERKRWIKDSLDYDRWK